jgi:hypothetical protein
VLCSEKLRVSTGKSDKQNSFRCYCQNPLAGSHTTISWLWRSAKMCGQHADIGVRWSLAPKLQTTFTDHATWTSHSDQRSSSLAVRSRQCIFLVRFEAHVAGIHTGVSAWDVIVVALARILSSRENHNRLYTVALRLNNVKTVVRRMVLPTNGVQLPRLDLLS